MGFGEKGEDGFPLSREKEIQMEKRGKEGMDSRLRGNDEWGVGMTKWVLGRRGKMDSRLRGNDGRGWE